MTHSICFSGGAKGADTLFGQQAEAAGHQVFHYGFPGMKSNQALFYLNEEQLVTADQYLMQANEKLKRGSFAEYKPYVKNLLRRNYFQVYKTNRVYAVSRLDMNKHEVMGGTGWAVTMAILLGCSHIYVYCQKEQDWFGYHALYDKFQPWVRMINKRPPKPEGYYTGIGSRELTNEGKHAITRLYEE